MKCKDFYMTQPLSYQLLILPLLPCIAQRLAACSFERMAEQVLGRDGYFISCQLAIKLLANYMKELNCHLAIASSVSRRKFGRILMFETDIKLVYYMFTWG